MICSKKNAFFDFFDFCIEGSPLWIEFGKICRNENFWNFQKKFQKWPVQDSSNIARNKLIKNQPIWGTHQWAANDKPPRGGVSPPPCRVGFKGKKQLILGYFEVLWHITMNFWTFVRLYWLLVQYPWSVKLWSRDGTGRRTTTLEGQTWRLKYSSRYNSYRLPNTVPKAYRCILEKNIYLRIMDKKYACL